LTESTVESLSKVVVDLSEKVPIRVLHVDDEAGFLKAAKQCLEMEGPFQIETALSVEEATEKMKKKKFDVIVSDYVMPGKDGLEFLKEMRDSGTNIPFIMFTGKGREEVAIKALNLGADQYLNKTGDPEAVYGELAHSIRTTVKAKKAEEALRNSEEKYRSIVELAPDCIMTFDLKGVITSCNTASTRLSGYSKDELVGKHFSKIGPIRARDIPKYLKMIPSTIRGKVPKPFEIIFQHKNGTTHQGEVHISLMKVGGKTIGLQAIMRDITERKKAEERVSVSEEKYRSLFENARDVTLTYDLKGNVTSINKAAVKYGFKKDEIIGKNILKFVPKKYWPKLLKELAQNAQGKTVEAEIEIITPKGKKIAEYGSAPIIIDDKVVGVQTILRDITEHKKILEELRSSEDRLKILFEFAPDAYYLNDLKGNFIDGNKAAEELTGYTREELIGKSFLKLKLLPRRQILKATTLLAKNALGKPTGPDEFILNQKDGTQVPVEIRTFPVKVKDQTVVLGIAHDITERKKAEAALSNSEEKYRNLFENARDVILTLDLKGNVTSINKAVARYGFKEEEIIGKNMRKFVPKKYWLRLLENISNISQGKPARGEIEIITPTGKIITEYQSNPISRGKKVVGIQSTLRNITERKRFEERLSALNIYSRKLNTAECMKEIYTLTLDAMEKTLGFEIAFFMVVGKDMLCVVDQRGYPRTLSIKLPLDGTKRGVSVKVARTGKPVIIPDAEKEDAWVEFWPGIRSGLDVPVKIGRKVLGVIGVESKTLNAFDEKDQELLEILASHAATAISNLEHAKNLEAYAREIRESQEKFERLFIDSPEAVVYTNTDFHILDINPRFTKLFGYSLDEIRGKHINDVIVPKDKMEEAEIFDKRASRGETYQEDTVRKRKDGTSIPVSFSAAPIIVENKTIGHVGVYKDITERKRFEERLSALNIYSRRLNMAESMAEIYRLTLDAMEKTLGFENAAFMVVDKGVLCVADQHGFPEPHLRLRLPLNGKRGITVKVAKTGRPVLVPDIRKERAYVEIMPGICSELDVPIKIGHKVLGVLNVESKRLNAFDEKDQKLLEILASHAATAISNLESQQKFKRLFMNNPEAADYLDPDFRILDVNPRFEELFGYSLDEIEGKHINDVIVPKDKKEEAEVLDKKAEEGMVYYDTVRKRKDGSLVPVSISAAPITIEDKIIGTVGVYKDISQLKRTEKTLKETLEKVETMNEKLGVVGKLTRHDARNKLSTVTMNVFLAKQKLAGDHETREYLSEIESACRQVERIFDFARIYEMLGVEELAYMDVEKSLEEAVMLFSDLHSVKIVNDCHGLTVLADSLLRQIFYNLIDNSLKHGKKINRIRVHFETGKDQLKLVYADDGVGIPKAEKEKIFKEGYGKGTGHGLYLIKRMCEVYGWTIRETGKQGKGAQFTITIPKVNENEKINYQLH
jgi:PAS domain S-box-containing protein